jgi:CRISPR-associated endonuclease/helicase Cas3
VLQCEEVDLVLHLISAHHGWARPSFGDDAGDPSYSSSVNDKAFNEVSRRFGYLQEKFGRWGLAWMESLLRCADIDASKPDVKLGNGELGEEVAS